jgi:hypothetical protein
VFWGISGGAYVLDAQTKYVMNIRLRIFDKSVRVISQLYLVTFAMDGSFRTFFGDVCDGQIFPNFHAGPDFVFRLTNVIPLSKLREPNPRILRLR